MSDIDKGGILLFSIAIYAGYIFFTKMLNSHTILLGIILIVAYYFIKKHGFTSSIEMVKDYYHEFFSGEPKQPTDIVTAKLPATNELIKLQHEFVRFIHAHFSMEDDAKANALISKADYYFSACMAHINEILTGEYYPNKSMANLLDSQNNILRILSDLQFSSADYGPIEALYNKASNTFRELNGLIATYNNDKNKNAENINTLTGCIDYPAMPAAYND